jgi:hypothetical protein
LSSTFYRGMRVTIFEDARNAKIIFIFVWN